MSTAKRITITQESVRLALAEMHAKFQATPVDRQHVRVSEQLNATPGEYAAAMAAWFFAHLEKHSETP